MKHNFLVLSIIVMTTQVVSAQNQQLMFKNLQPLPDKNGFAGMYGGTMDGKLFCMGGANFPDKMPWEKGIKRFYDYIFMFDGKNWVKRKEKLPLQVGYGIAGSYNNKIYLAGGNNGDAFYDNVFQVEMVNGKLISTSLPSLPIPIAFAAGTVVNNLLVVAGGASSLTGKPLKKCFVLNLENSKKGWFELEPWPGSERRLPVCGANGNSFYLFSGETITENGKREILEDAYELEIMASGNSYTANWKQLSTMPKGVSAGPSPVPFIKNLGFVFWGGVDAVTALYSDASSHMGINKYVINYQVEKDEWNCLKPQDSSAARVGAPVVHYNGKWVYVNGETKPGVRTNKVVAIE